MSSNTKKKKNDKSIVVYPYFLEMAKHTSDVFWNDLLTNCAYNKFPRGILYLHDSNSISIKKNNKIIYTNINTTDSKQACQQIIELCQKYKNILSTHDCDDRNEISTKTLQKTVTSYETFKKISTKRGKKHIIEEYVIKYLNEHPHISMERGIYIYNRLISILIDNKIISTDNIIYKDQEIVEITGVKISDDGNVIIDEKYEKKNYEKNENSKTLYEMWKKDHDDKLKKDMIKDKTIHEDNMSDND